MTGKEWQKLCFVLNNGGFFKKQILRKKKKECCFSVYEFPSFADFLLFPFKHRLLLVWLHQQAGWGKVARLPFWQGIGMDAPGSLGRALGRCRGLARFVTNRTLFLVTLLLLLFCQSLCCFVTCYRLLFLWRKQICVTESQVKRFTAAKLKEMWWRP